MQLPHEKPKEPSIRLYRGLKTPTLRNRVIALLVAFTLCVTITAVGTTSKIESLEAHNIVGEFNETEKMLNTISVQFIFGNNLMYRIVMFFPVLGPYYGSMVLYSTGRVLAALGVTTRVNPLGLFITLFIYPHAWLVFVSYSLAISESFWLIYAFVTNRGIGLRNELSTAAKIMAMCVVLLLLAAYTEMYVISAATS
jgi:uncharacterized membrane protein SpoIIM required for sporulation